jgi:hypothetical protein
MGQRAEERRERREEERRLSALPRIVIRESGFRYPWQRKEIQVSLPEGHLASKRGLFYVVAISNDGERRTEHIQPTVGSEMSQFAIPLDFIWEGEETLHVRWNGTLDEFDMDDDRFATALVRDRNIRIENPALDGKSFPFAFLLFFTLEDSPKIYLPSRYKTVLATMPCKFNMELHVTATGVPRKHLMTCAVEATDWKTVYVTQYPVE